jgi:signal transduction histidine kinase
VAATRTDGRLSTNRPASARLREVRSSRISALVISAALVAASTLLVGVLTPDVPVRSAGVFYLLAVLAVSSIYGLWWGLATSLASALSFNFFFLPPRHTLVINSSSDWLALAAFAVTAVVTSDLAARERAGREAAARRAEEARLGERLATVIATAPNLDDALAGLGDQEARTLGAETGVIVRGVSPTRRPGVVPLELNRRPIGELRLSGGDHGIVDSPAAGRIARQLAGLIALGEERERRMREEVNAKALLRSDELKTALLRAVSHDLRSPLQAITAAAGGLHFAALDSRSRSSSIGTEQADEPDDREPARPVAPERGRASPGPDWLDRASSWRRPSSALPGEPHPHPGRGRRRRAAGARRRAAASACRGERRRERAQVLARRPDGRCARRAARGRRRDRGTGPWAGRRVRGRRADLRAVCPRRPDARHARIRPRPRHRPRARGRQRRGPSALARDGWRGEHVRPRAPGGSG